MPSARPAAASGREGLWLALCLALLTVLPFLVVHYPQMDDYPAHLARYRIMLDHGQDPDLARFYAFDWRWSGNLGVDILIRPLAGLVGLDRAGWLIAAAIAPLTGLGLMAVEWSLRRRVSVGTVLAMTAIWSASLRMGFLNYALALALALFAFALWIALAGRRWRAALFIPVALAVWLCHISGWGLLGLMVFGYEWQQRGHPIRAMAQVWPLLAPLVPVVLTGGGEAGGLNYGPDVLSYKKDILIQALRGDWRVPDIACVGLLVLAMAEARSRKALDGRAMVPALLVLAAALILPRHLGGGDFADARLVPVALMLGCLAIDAKLPRWALPVAALPMLLRLGLLSVTWHDQSRALDRMLVALNRIPAGARVASAVAEDGDDWPYPVYNHIGAYATLRRSALVNAHFALPGIHMLRLKTAGQEFADPSQKAEWRKGQAVDLTGFAPAKAADYLWYVGPTAGLRLPPGAKVLSADGESLLAQLPQRPDATAR